MISDYTIKAVKELPITSILDREGVKYKRSGKEAITLCPWHNDKNPSLTINDDKGFCYCFVCQTGKDGIGFVQQFLGTGFSEAVERIASNHEIPIIYEDIDPELAAREAARKKQFISQLLEQQELFRSLLKDPRAERIRNFLDNRGILPSTSKHFGLGYCVKGFFADRITIPIHDHIGNLIGFTGRVTNDNIKPKYKNTENNECFDKSKIVFNEFQASQHIREADSVIFVEGHFDVISLWQIGIGNAVAMQGTAAPSEYVINRLTKKTKRFILCYDADEGGRKAIEQFTKVAGPYACRGNISISIAILPEGTDPDLCAREGKVDLVSVLENAIPWFDWQLDQWFMLLDRSDTAKFVETEQKIKEFINSIESIVLRQYYIDKASKVLAEDDASAIKIAREWNESSGRARLKRTWTKPTIAEIRENAEKRLLRMYIHYPDVRDECRPLMERLESPIYRWMWSRVTECEQYGGKVELRMILMSILAICEPYYTRQLRPLVMPTIKLKRDNGILKHASDVLIKSL